MHRTFRRQLTNDKDFGEKVYREKHPHRGVIFLRLQDEPPAAKIGAIEKLLDAYEDQLADAFVVVTETQVPSCDARTPHVKCTDLFCCPEAAACLPLPRCHSRHLIP